MGKGITLVKKIIREVDKSHKRSVKEREKAQRDYEQALIKEQREDEKEQKRLEKENILREKEREKRLASLAKENIIKAKEYFKKEIDKEALLFETRVDNRKALCIKMIREVLK